MNSPLFVIGVMLVVIGLSPPHNGAGFGLVLVGGAFMLASVGFFA